MKKELDKLLNLSKGPVYFLTLALFSYLVASFFLVGYFYLHESFHVLGTIMDSVLSFEVPSQTEFSSWKTLEIPFTCPLNVCVEVNVPQQTTLKEPNKAGLLFIFTPFLLPTFLLVLGIVLKGLPKTKQGLVQFLLISTYPLYELIVNVISGTDNHTGSPIYAILGASHEWMFIILWVNVLYALLLLRTGKNLASV